jgi:hypothetical protein
MQQKYTHKDTTDNKMQRNYAPVDTSILEVCRELLHEEVAEEPPWKE